MMIVALGCNVYKGGIHDIRPKTLRRTLDKVKDTITNTDEEVDNEVLLFNLLLDHTAMVTKLGIKSVDTLVKAIIYEPTNCADCCRTLTFLLPNTHTLMEYCSTYLSDFAATGNTFVLGCQLLSYY